jgi:hypothetical protein
VGLRVRVGVRVGLGVGLRVGFRGGGVGIRDGGNLWLGWG